MSNHWRIAIVPLSAALAKGGWDIVLSDHGLPKFNSFEFWFKLRPAQFAQHQSCVVFLVLNDEDS